MTRRDFRQAAVALLLVFAFVFTTRAALGHELPAAPPAPNPASAEGTAFVHGVAAWVERSTGVTVQRRDAHFVDAFSWPGLEHAAAIVTGADGERIEFDRGCERAIAGLGMRRGKPWSPYCARVVLHEVMHRWGGGSPFPEWARWVEHGLVEAVAEDLWPAFVFQLGGRRGVQSPFTVHTDAVAHVRRASAVATGRPWRSREARVWRRSVWGMDELQRDRAFSELGMLCSTCREREEIPPLSQLPPAPDAPG